MDHSEVAIARVAIVTGAGSGIGQATAELFAQRGYSVVANDMTLESLNWTKSTQSPESFVCVAGDVSQADTNTALVAAAIDNFGRLDVSILNAGVTGTLPWEDPDAIAKFERILAINVTGVARGIQCASAVMKAQGSGAILATASTSGLRGDPGN